MRFGRRFNHSIAHLLMAVLLYAQLATAAYACPEPLRQGAPVAMAEMPGCNGQMGATAIELLCQRLADPTLPSRHVSLHPELITRQSCGAALARPRN